MANFVVSGTPHVRSKESIQSIMRDVIIALVPATAAGIYYFCTDPDHCSNRIFRDFRSSVPENHEKTCYSKRSVRSCNWSVTGNEPACSSSRLGCYRR